MWNVDIETLSFAERVALEENALAQQFAYVMAHSALYQHKLRGAQNVSSRAELAALPFTEKDELRASQEEFPPFGNYLAAPIENVSRVHKTSGTTGRPLYIALTARDIETTHECGARAYVCAGLQRGDRVVHCLNYQMWAGGVTDHLSLERAGATVIPFGVGNTHVLLRTIRDLGINAISSTPSYLVHLADIVQSELHIEPHELGLRKGFLAANPVCKIRTCAAPSNARGICARWMPITAWRMCFRFLARNVNSATVCTFTGKARCSSN